MRDVRFGSLAGICSAKGHVRLTPNSDRKSGFSQKVMSALPPRADMCRATSDFAKGHKRTFGAKIAYGTIEVRGDERVRLPAFC
jgi:hypothetical protein